MRLSSAIGASVLFVSLTARAAPPTASLLPHPPAIERLDNGLTVVTVPFPSPGTVSYFTLVRAGSRDEVEPGKSGYAHLFEHLMFRGTEAVSSAEYERKMQALGADSNAFTTDDFTLYVPTIPKESLPELIGIEAERFKHLSYSQPAYKDETGAVMGEYNKNAANPGRAVDEALREIAFKVHTYGHTTLGYRRDVEAMPAAYEYSRSFFKRFYTPDDCTLFVVGDFDRAKVMELVTRQYNDWQGKRVETSVKPEPEQNESRKKALTWKSPTAPRLAVAYKIPATGASLRDAAALAVVTQLAFGESSDLYRRLVVEEQKLLELSSDPDDVLTKDPGLFRVDAKLKEKTSFDEIAGALDDALGKIGKGEVPQARFDAVRNHLVRKSILDLQTPTDVAQKLATFTAVTGDVRSFEAYFRELSQVTPADVVRVASKYLVTSRRSVVTLTAGAKK
jgi:zinc protease